MRLAQQILGATFLMLAALSLTPEARANANYTLEGTLTLKSGSDPLGLNGKDFTATLTLGDPDVVSTTTSSSFGAYLDVTALSLSAGALGPINCGGQGAAVSITDNVTGNDSLGFSQCLLSLSSWAANIQIAGRQLVTAGSTAILAAPGLSGQASYSIAGLVTVFDVVDSTLAATGDQPPAITPSPSAVNKIAAVGSTTVQQQVVDLSAAFPVSYQVSTTGGSWLSVTPSVGNTGTDLVIKADPAGLPAGVYQGTVTVDPGQGTPAQIAVTLTVQADAPTLSAAPTSLTFGYQLGGTAPAAKTIQVTGTSPLNISVSAPSWLTVAPTSGPTPSALTVSVNTAGLSAGALNGSITITSAGASNSPLTVPVTLNVTGPPSLSAAPTSLTFNYQLGGTAPAAKTVQVTGTPPLNISVSAPSWLTVSPTSGSTPRTLTVSVKTAGLSAGTLNGSITITSAGASNSPLTVPVALTITEAGQLTFSREGVVNAATFVSGDPPAIGGLASVFGVFPGVQFAAASAIPLPRSLDGASITLTQAPSAALSSESGAPNQSVSVVAPLLFVSASQINFQVPWEIRPGVAEMVVSADGEESDPVNVEFRDTAPGIFTLDFGPGRGVAFMTDGAVAQTAGSVPGLLTRPVRIGEPLIILATGLGPLTGPPMESGNNSLDENGAFVQRDTAVAPRVFVGGQEAQVAFSGASPEFVGVYQVNIVAVPQGVVPGTAVPLVIQMGEVRSREDVTIAVTPAQAAVVEQ